MMEMKQMADCGSHVSLSPTPYAVVCTTAIDDGPGCGKVYMTLKGYDAQMARPNQTWRCPRCGSASCYFDDENYEKHRRLMAKSRVQELRDAGFDESTYNNNGSWSVRCSCCAALVINGIPCHELGCPNKSYEEED